MIRLNTSIDHKRFFVIFSSFLAIMTVFCCVACFLTFYLLFAFLDPDKIFYIFISNVFTNCFTTMALVTLLLLLYCFYARFNLINACIHKNFATHEDDVEEFAKKKASQKSCIKIVLKLADLHDSLVDATIEMNRCFSFQMMNTVAVIFCSNIFTTFAIYRVFVRNDYNNFYRAVVQYGWNLYFMFFGLGIVSLGSLLTRAGKHTAVLCHKAINYIEDDEDVVIDYVSFNLFIRFFRFFFFFLLLFSIS